MRRSKADAEITRCTLHTAAADHSAKKGIRRTRLEDIAVSAGVTRGAIYWHFSDKESLIAAMIDRVSGPTEAAMADLISSQTPEAISLETLKKVVVDAFARVCQSPSAAQITSFMLRYSLSKETELLTSRIEENRRLNLSHISQFIERAQQAGIITTKYAPECLANHIRGHIVGLFHQHLSSPAPGLGLETVANSMDLLLKGLSPANNAIEA
jgi:AcrR family transcriptional regulator